MDAKTPINIHTHHSYQIHHDSCWPPEPVDSELHFQHSGYHLNMLQQTLGMTALSPA